MQLMINPKQFTKYLDSHLVDTKNNYFKWLKQLLTDKHTLQHTINEAIKKRNIAIQKQKATDSALWKTENQVMYPKLGYPRLKMNGSISHSQ